MKKCWSEAQLKFKIMIKDSYPKTFPKLRHVEALHAEVKYFYTKVTRVALKSSSFKFLSKEEHRKMLNQSQNLACNRTKSLR